MPLVLITGYPCSGKSKTAAILKEKLQESGSKNVLVICDTDAGNAFDFNIYQDSNLEKSHRSFLRSEVVKHLNKDTVLILDSTNYIKGFRYELFCVAKSAKTTYCVVWCNETKENCNKYNEERPQNERYSIETLDALIMRYEPPESRNRWDSPLFNLDSNKRDESGQFVIPENSLEEFVTCVKEGKVLIPNLSTQTQPISDTNFLYELDRITQEIVRNVLEEQKMAQIGDNVCVFKDGKMLNLKKMLTCGELAKLRRQFVGYSKTHPINDFQAIPQLFIAFIENHQA